jgi:hypothetical protein
MDNTTLDNMRKEIFNYANIKDDFLNQINRNLNIDLALEKNNLDYEHSPHTLLFFTAPDCQNINNDKLLTYLNELASINLNFY